MPSKVRKIFIVHGSHHLTDHEFNGDGLVAWGFISELVSRGHRVHVLTDHLAVRAKIPHNLTLIEIPRKHRNPIFHYLSYIWQARKTLEKVLQAEGVDVVHQMNPVVRGISLAAIGKNTPIVLGTYVGDWLRLPTNPERRPDTFRNRVIWLTKHSLDLLQQLFATSIVLASPNALQRVPLSKLVKSKIEYLHHGVDTDTFTPEAQSGDIGNREQTVLYLGAFHLQKGVLDLIEAFARCVTLVPDARLIMVGAGFAEKAMRTRIQELGLSNKVEIHGRATRSQVAQWMRACSALCAPSHGEPYGQNVLEAMATQKPVIITNSGGHRYLSDDSGKVDFAPGDIIALSDAIRKVLTNSDLMATMGRRNYEIVLAQHAWPRAVDRLEAIYERAIARFKA